MFNQKEYMKEWLARPGNKRLKAELQGLWRSIPENKFRCREYARAYYNKYIKGKPITDRRKASRGRWRKSAKGLESRRMSYVKRAYGITREQYSEMISSQDGRCKICRDARPLYIDHNHATGRIRGLLCNQCNAGLGMFKDNPEKLQQAIVYLVENKEG